MDTERKLRPGEPAGCTATSLLKLLALVFMFCDHSGKMVFGNATELRLLGRLAFPLYCWCMAVGGHYTHSVPRYLLRLAVLFVVSQPLYMVALNHGWNEPNIFLTLIMGLLGIWGLRARKWGSHIWGPILVLVLSQALNCNYGWKGVLLILLLYLVRDSRTGIACVMLPFCLYWGSSSSVVRSLFGISLSWPKGWPGSELYSAFMRLQTLAILSLPLLLMRPGEKLRRLKLPRWLDYSLYPAHLVVLLLMECLMLKNGAADAYHRMMGLLIDPVLNLLGLG